MINRCAAEFFGTFTLVFAGCLAIVVDQRTGGFNTVEQVFNVGELGHIGICLVFGVTVMAMVYAFGEISGAHINPAVTFGFWWAGRYPGREVIPYIFSQMAGAVVAMIVLRLIFVDVLWHSTWGITLPANNISLWVALFLETLFTFILMMVIIHVSTGSKETGTMAGIAIGGTVMVLALIGGPLTGASMNPARSFGPFLVINDALTRNLSTSWIYIVGPFLGAFLATLSCRYTRGNDNCC